VYSPENVERALNMATASFCSQETEVDGRARKVVLSKIFLWYGTDFGETTYEVLEWMLRYLPAGPATVLQGILGAWEVTPTKVAYHKYDWGINKPRDEDDKKKSSKKQDKEKKSAEAENVIIRSRSETTLMVPKPQGKAARTRSLSN
jgi:hypothetical protein